MVMHLVAQGVGVITIINSRFAGYVYLVEARLHCRGAFHGLLAISVVKVSLLKELNFFRAKIVGFS